MNILWRYGYKSLALRITLLIIIVCTLFLFYRHLAYHRSEKSEDMNTENMEQIETRKLATKFKSVHKPLSTVDQELLQKYQASIEIRTQHAEALKCMAERKNQKEAQKCLVTFIETPDWTCPGQTIRLGHETLDGGWSACVSKAGFTQPCIVFSFGIEKNWLFDDDISKNHSCTVHAFDPSIKTSHFDRSKSIHFYDVGLGVNDTLRDTHSKFWPMMTFKTILSMLGLSHTPINMVKMDIELGELITLPLMAQDGSLANVQQIAFELHLNHGKQMRIYADMFKALEAANFAHYFTRPNLSAHKKHFGGTGNACCYEVNFFNKALVRSLL